MHLLPQSEHRRLVGQRLRRLFELLGLTQVEAAEIMGVTKGVVHHWVVGNHYPQPYALYRLCRLKGVDFNYVFLGDWAQLPSALGRPLMEELQSALEASPEPARRDGEKRRVRVSKP